jgi:hypothetical protein
MMVDSKTLNGDCLKVVGVTVTKGGEILYNKLEGFIHRECWERVTK